MTTCHFWNDIMTDLDNKKNGNQCYLISISAVCVIRAGFKPATF